MAKRKDSMALFEAISKSKDKQSKTGFVPPTWLAQQAQEALKNQPDPQQPTTDGPADPPQQPAQVVQVSSPPRPRASVWSRPNNQPAVDSGFAKAAKLLMQYPMHVAAGAALLIVVIAAIVAIAALTDRSPDGPAVAASTQEGTANVAAANVNVAAGAAVASLPTERIKGKYYLVIESLVGASPADRAEAQEIVAFLAERGEGATIEPMNSGKQLAIWSMRGFDAAGSDEAKDFALQIEEVGREYQSQGGNYRFQQRAKPTAELRPWYEPY